MAYIMEHELLKCKACGYIIDQGKLKDVCPACGLPKTVFEPYKDNASPGRNAIINMHLHPIAVHFPQAFVIVLIPLIVIGLITDINDIMAAAKVLSLVLPAFTLAALIAGLIDGKIRFKKLSTPALKTKIIFGTILLILSCIVASTVFLFGLGTISALTVVALLILCTGCQVVLGSIGAKLMMAKLGGKL